MLKLNEELAGFSRSMLKLPENSLKRPYTQARPRCEILKFTPEWAASMLYSSAARAVAALPSMMRTASTPTHVRLTMCKLLCKDSRVHQETRPPSDSEIIV